MVQEGRARASTAALLFACWLVLAVDRVLAGRPAELLWTCYAAIALMALAEAFALRRLLAAGLLFHATVGAPAYALQVVVTERADVAGVLAHMAPVVVGVLRVRARGWPRGVLPVSLAMYLACWTAARLWTDPRLNVNLAHDLWYPLRGHLDPSPWWPLAAAAPVVVLLAAGNGLAGRLCRPQAA